MDRPDIKSENRKELETWICISSCGTGCAIRRSEDVGIWKKSGSMTDKRAHKRLRKAERHKV